MSSFERYLNELDPAGNECNVCGANRYTCACDDTPAIDNPLNVVMVHPMKHKRQIVERFTDKHIVLRANGWTEEV